MRYHGRILKQTVVLQETHFTINKVKIRRNFESGELMIVETGTTISENLANPNGFIIDSGTYVLPKIVIPCAYQTIKSIMGTPTPTLADGGVVITSETHQVHIHTHGTLNPPDKCPLQGTYRETGHPDIVVFEPRTGPNSPEVTFSPIDPRQISIPNMVTLKVEWALFKTSKKFGLVHNISKQAECSDLKRLTDGGQDRPELQGTTETLLYAKGEMLYNVKCPKIKVGLDLTLGDSRCYKYLPVMVKQSGRPADKRFLIPGSRLLSNISDSEPCDSALKVPRGYITTEGLWVAMSPRPRVLVAPTELQIEVLTSPDTYEAEAKGGAYMDRDLAEWARAFAWDARQTITQTYEGRLSQSMTLAEQFQQGFSREQFAKYLDDIESQASFLSFLDPIKAYLTPKLIFIGSMCSLTICCFTGVMSLHGAYRYIQQSRLAQVTISVVTVLKLLCCAPAAILADEMYRHSFAASMDRDYGHIPEIRRAERRRTVKAITALKTDTKKPAVPQPECNYSEALLPLNKTAPSAPMYEGKGSTITAIPTIVPFVYPQVPGISGLNHDIQRPLPNIL